MANITDETSYSSKRGVISWMFFDWAAQPYHTVIITFIFAPYFAAFVAPTPLQGQEMWGYASAIAGICIALLAPVLGSIADVSGPRKPWIAGFSLIAIIGAAMLYFALPSSMASTSTITITLIAFIIALIGIEFSAVFINAMMPDLVPRSELGKLSGSGWALGYVGGVVALIIILGFMSADPTSGKTLLGLDPIFGLDAASNEGDRASGPFSAIWYLIFVIPMFLFTPDKGRIAETGSKLSKGLSNLLATLKSLPKRPSLSSFLISSMLYRDGLNALYAFGGIYAATVLGLSIIQVGVFGILAAFTGAIGAFFGGRLDAKFGPRPVVFISCWLLVLACTIIVSTTQEVTLFVLPISSEAIPVYVFYGAGALIGAAGGALQAASRTLLVDQVDKKDTTQAFGLYALTGRATAFIGPLAIAFVTAASQSQRIGITPVIVLLALGAIGLMWVKTKEG
ncbi:MAG: MFS transporter [Devosiaceae bacterium]|nr:MFS transporter [Devosiaceae bacterium]